MTPSTAFTAASIGLLTWASTTSGLAPDAAGVLERYLRIAGDPDEALAALRALSAEAKLDLSLALDEFEQRSGFIAAAGIDVLHACTIVLLRTGQF